MTGVFKDMVNLLEERLHRTLEDHADLCDRADINHEAIAQMLIAALLRELTIGMITAYRISEDDFTRMCREAYRTMTRHHRNHKKTKRAALAPEQDK
jgi:predicted nucleic acid-binding OB-fold protein